MKLMTMVMVFVDSWWHPFNTTSIYERCLINPGLIFNAIYIGILFVIVTNYNILLKVFIVSFEISDL